MPRAPRFKTGAIEDLFRQLRYAPTETRERLLEQAERLAVEVQPGRAYPEEFVVFRVTGYRPRSLEPGVMLVGDALLADLAVFIRRLSETLPLPSRSESRGESETIERLAERLGVTDRTVRRWHQRGLLLHSVIDGRGERRIACYAASLEAFRRRVGDEELERAASFSRVESEAEHAIIAEAIELAQKERLSRQAIARRLAPRHDRAVETIRSVLARHEERVGRRVFPGIERTDAQERRLIVRAASRGLLVAEIARRLGRSPITIRRVVNRERLERLRGLSVTCVKLATFDLEGAAEVILAPAWVRFGLAPPATEDAIAMLQSFPSTPGPDPASLEARLAGYNFLKHRAVGLTSGFSGEPTDERLDRAETDLRWSAMLKRTIVRDLLPIGVARVNATIARPLIQQSAEMIRAMLSLLIEAISEAVESFDPGGRHRIERVAAYAAERALARQGGVEPVGRAGARHAPGSVPLADPFHRLLSWQAEIECPLRLLRRSARLSGARRDVFAARHGLAGEAPMTVEEVMERFGMSHRRIDRLLREAASMLRRSDDAVT